MINTSINWKYEENNFSDGLRNEDVPYLYSKNNLQPNVFGIKVKVEDALSVTSKLLPIFFRISSPLTN